MARCSTLMPSSTRLTFIRLLVKSPAHTSSAIEIAICDRRQRRAEPFARTCPPPGWPACPLSVVSRLGLVLCQAGNSPKSRPVPIVTRGGEQQHRAVHPDLQRLGGFVGQHREDQVERPSRHEQAGEAADHRQHHRLGQQLADQLPAVGADRQADRHLARPRRRPRQQQVGDVRAGDEQDQAGDRQQQQQRRRGLRGPPSVCPRAPGSSSTCRALNRAIV